MGNENINKKPPYETKEYGILDIFLSKISSRKLLIAFISTVLVIYGKISGDNWEKVIMVYLISQSAADYAIKRYFGGDDSYHRYGNNRNNWGNNPNDWDLSGEGEDDLGGDYINPEDENNGEDDLAG